MARPHVHPAPNAAGAPRRTAIFDSPPWASSAAPASLHMQTSYEGQEIIALNANAEEEGVPGRSAAPYTCAASSRVSGPPTILLLNLKETSLQMESGRSTDTHTR